MSRLHCVSLDMTNINYVWGVGKDWRRSRQSFPTILSQETPSCRPKRRVVAERNRSGTRSGGDIANFVRLPYPLNVNLRLELFFYTKSIKNIFSSFFILFKVFLWNHKFQSITSTISNKDVIYCLHFCHMFKCKSKSNISA